jgi:serine/threonine protein kinase
MVDRIGQGGMVVAFDPRQPSPDRIVAVKLLPLEVVNNLALVDRFRREAGAVSVLCHPNAATICDLGEHEGALFFVTEFIGGGTERDRFAGRLDPAAADNMLAQMASILDYAHARSVFECEMKRANVLLKRVFWAPFSRFAFAPVASKGTLRRLASRGW